MRISTHEIAVVIQGPMCLNTSPRYRAAGITLQLLANLASLLPGAQLVLSTWVGQDTSSVPAAVEIVLSEDPGSQGGLPGLVPNNVNRQLVSTREGLKKVTRRYVLKIRSDMVLESTGFLDYFVRGNTPALRDHHASAAVLSARLVCNNLSSRHPVSCSAAFLNHPGDHIQFGLTEDVKSFWAGELQSEEDAQWFQHYPYPDGFRGRELSRFTPEQHIWIGALRAKGIRVPMADYRHRTPELTAQSEALLAANFIFVPDHQFVAYFPKYHSVKQATFEFMRKNSMRELGAFDALFELKCAMLRKLKLLTRLVQALAHRLWV